MKSVPGFGFSTEIKLNIGKPRVIWIEPDQDPLPAGETLTVELTGYAMKTTPAKRTFDVYEVDPEGARPVIGSELTFMEVPVVGGECMVSTTGQFNLVLPSRARVDEPDLVGGRLKTHHGHEGISANERRTESGK